MGSRIAKVEVGRYDYLFKGSFKFFPPGPDGRSRRASVVVRLTDEDGVQGIGQAVPIPTWTYETPETVLSTLRDYLAPALVGADPADLPAIHATMNQVIRPAFSVGQPLAKAAIDLACFDLAAKQRGLSAGELLVETAPSVLAGARSSPASTAVHDPLGTVSGGATSHPPSLTQPRRQITLSWTINSPDMAVVEQQLDEGRRLGFRHFNIKVGAPQTPEYDLELARKVREFAPDGFLWADANTGYTVDQALQMAPKLADLGVDVLESPLPPNRIRGYQALKKQGALPILMDEGILSPVEAEEFAALGMMDGIAMKPARNAGLYPSLMIISVLKERGMMVLGSGLTDPDLSLAASLHLYAWAGIDFPCALNGPQFLAESLARHPLTPENGVLDVPGGPGLGLELDPELLGRVFAG